MDAQLRVAGTEFFTTANLDGANGVALTPPAAPVAAALIYVNNIAGAATSGVLINHAAVATPTITNSGTIFPSASPIRLQGDLRSIKLKNKTGGDCSAYVVYLRG